MYFLAFYLTSESLKSGNLLFFLSRFFFVFVAGTKMCIFLSFRELMAQKD